MRDERPSTTGHRHTLPAEKSSPLEQADGRGVAVGSNVEDSLQTTGDGDTQIEGNYSQAGRDLYHAGRDQHFHVISSPTTLRVPLTTPAPPEHFTGRTKTLEGLTSRILSGESVGLTALQGMGGIGKTAVALKLAERLRANHAEAFPGGVLWCSLGPEPEILTVLDAWARAARLDADLSSILDPSARAVAVRQLLASQGRFCAIIDDVWKAVDARLLLEALPPDTPGLITTRLGDVAKRLRCTVFNLEKLSEREALDLITKHLGGLDDFEPAARQVVEQTEALPLALEIAIGYIEEPAELPDLANDLARRSRLVVLAQGDVREDSIEICFSLSYDKLDAEDQRRFRALGAFADAPFDAHAVTAVWGEDDVDTARLRFFSRRNLIQRDLSTGILRLHGLLKEFALMLLEQEGESREARDRHAEYYRNLAYSASWQITESAYEQVRYGWKHVSDDPEASVGYVLSCVGFQKTRGHWKDRELWLEVAFAQSQPESDHRERALILHEMGVVLSDLGRKEEALLRLQNALELSQDIANREIEGTVLNSIAAVYDDLGSKDTALQKYKEALEVRREAGDRRGEGQTLNNIASVYSAIGRKDEALQRFEEALAVRREVEDRRGEGTTLNNIAAVYDDLGRKDDALRRYEDALEVRREVGDRWGEGTTLNNIAAVYDDLGRKNEALRKFQEVLQIRRDVGDRQGEGTTLNNIAAVNDDLGHKDEALQKYEEALKVLREVGSRWSEATVLANFARTLSSDGCLQEAVEALEACVALDEALGHPDLENDRAFLEKVRKELAESEHSA